MKQESIQSRVCWCGKYVGVVLPCPFLHRHEPLLDTCRRMNSDKVLFSLAPPIDLIALHCITPHPGTVSPLQWACQRSRAGGSPTRSLLQRGLHGGLSVLLPILFFLCRGAAVILRCIGNEMKVMGLRLMPVWVVSLTIIIQNSRLRLKYCYLLPLVTCFVEACTYVYMFTFRQMHTSDTDNSIPFATDEKLIKHLTDREGL